MGRFEKLNSDIYTLTDEILNDQVLCKLLYYNDEFPLNHPDINGQRLLLHKRVLPFRMSVPMASEKGSYLLVLPRTFRASRGNNYISTVLHFEAYTHEESKVIYYENDKGKVVVGDRVMLIFDRIEKFMENSMLSIGKNNLVSGEPIISRNNEFTGYWMAYTDVDFRS